MPPPPNEKRPAYITGSAQLSTAARSKAKPIVRYPTAGNALRVHLDEIRKGGSLSAAVEERRKDKQEKKSGKVLASRLLDPVVEHVSVKRLVLKRRSSDASPTITSLRPAHAQVFSAFFPQSAAIAAAETLGRTARLRRQSLRLTQKQLAMHAGVGRRFIVDLERGKPTLEIGKVLTVVQALGLTLSAQAPDVG
jgi:y4mF family transcriptional regulator